MGTGKNQKQKRKGDVRREQPDQLPKGKKNGKRDRGIGRKEVQKGKLPKRRKGFQGRCYE